MDIGVLNYWPRTGIQDATLQRDIGDRLTILYYRGRIQLCVLEVFMGLHRKGVLSLEALRKPWGACGENCDVLSQRLMVFEEVHKEMEMDMKPPEQQPHPCWDRLTTIHTLEWLATMIIRECKYVNEGIEEIENSGMMRRRNEAAWQTYQTWCAGQKIKCNPEESVADGGLPDPPFFGFWLPHGLGNIPRKEKLGGLWRSMWKVL